MKGILQPSIFLHRSKIPAHQTRHRRIPPARSQLSDQITTTQHAHQLAIFDHRKILLLASNQFVQRGLQPVVRCQRAKPRDHRLPRRHVSQQTLHLHKMRFLLGAQIDEQGNKKQEKIEQKQAQQAEQDGDKLSHSGRDLCSLRIVKLSGQSGPQHASTIHREGRYQVEYHQNNVDQHQLDQKRTADRLKLPYDQPALDHQDH